MKAAAGPAFSSVGVISRSLPAVPQIQRSTRSSRQQIVAGVFKKTNSYDEEWKRGFFGSGYFVEDREVKDANYLRSIEKKKLLSTIEKAGILSKLEKAGLSLSTLERLGAFSTAERLGLLTLAEEYLVSDPAKIVSFSLVPLLGTIGALTLIPDDNVAAALAKYTVAAVFAGSTLVFFVSGFVLAAIQED